MIMIMNGMDKVEDFFNFDESFFNFNFTQEHNILRISRLLEEKQ
jgi:hypothetical protein